MTTWNTPFTLTAHPLNEASYDENKARRMCQEKVNEIHDRFTRLEKETWRGNTNPAQLDQLLKGIIAVSEEMRTMIKKFK